MQYLLNAKEMKQADTNTIEHFRVPSLVLMERAACATVGVQFQFICTELMYWVFARKNQAYGNRSLP